jgi:hypothetical protein
MKRAFALMLVVACSDAKAVAPATKPVVASESAVSRVPLGERLALEAASRPQRAVRPAQLLEALERAGVVFTRKRQVLASPVEASYCETALTGRGLALALCEFADAAAAQRGLARSHDSFDAMIPGRTLDTRFNTLLTVTQPSDADAERERELARTTFAELRPTGR